VKAEFAWQDHAQAHARPLHIFRLAGIYGPGRSVFDQIRGGTARRIVKPGHAFSRIHVDDIVQVLMASITAPEPGAIYNVADDEAAEQADVVSYACGLLGVPAPPTVAFEDAEKTMSPMARSFWDDDRRVDNAKLKSALGVTLRYPTYREGLQAILAGERA
jgi:nucleoside-diphosphate-sugar epimerase